MEYTGDTELIKKPTEKINNDEPIISLYQFSLTKSFIDKLFIV
jgi:hypothetical protein